MNGGFWNRRRVFITGHTGFKGSWLSLWLGKMGADVVGYSLGVPSDPNHFQLLDLGATSVEGDIRSRDDLHSAIVESEPEIVFHLAAQALVRHSYRDPLQTLSTNIIGTANLLEACRHAPSVRAIVNVTSDKCYENREWVWAYRENDALGGRDPYSASKACAEMVAASYLSSFFNLNEYGETHGVLLASVRAGNVVGGGDWAEDRLIPDIMKAASRHTRVVVRNGAAVRPWQHVLEPLSGYLLLGRRLLEGRKEFAGAWNFGPNQEARATVQEVVLLAQKTWPVIEYTSQPTSSVQLHEATSLTVDSSKARSALGWKPTWDLASTIAATVDWYRAFYDEGIINTEADLDRFIEESSVQGGIV
jgi:CDP-glucose 4,6-dehydratase